MLVATVGLFFYPSQTHIGPIWLNKLAILSFSEKMKSLKLIFKNPRVNEFLKCCCIKFKYWFKRIFSQLWLFNMPFQKWISFVIPTDQKMIAFIFLKSHLVKAIAKKTTPENDSNMFEGILLEERGQRCNLNVMLLSP